jgi:hypothetical protein
VVSEDVWQSRLLLRLGAASTTLHVPLVVGVMMVVQLFVFVCLVDWTGNVGSYYEDASRSKYRLSRYVCT